jgi:hypothetical protein
MHYGKKCHCHAAHLCHVSAHGKEVFTVRWHQTARQRMVAWQRMKKTHGKEWLHGKE